MTRVYLIFRTQMFSDAVGAILDSHPKIELVGSALAPDQIADQIADEVARLEPDVILLEEDEHGSAVVGVRKLLASPSPYRLIMLRVDNDGMHVWSQTWHQSIRPQDLTDAIVSAKESSPGQS